MQDLGIVAGQLMDSGLKASTLKTYASAQRSYLQFCESYSLTPVPTSDATLLLYVAFLFRRGLKGSSIKVYLAGVRNLHVVRSLPYPDYSPQLQLALRGAVKLSDPPERKLPITFSVLSRMFEYLQGRHDELMLKTVMAVAYFGCFRAGELCLQDSLKFDSSLHLTCGDVTFHVNDKFFTLLLKSSKTDVAGKGVPVHVGCSGHEICAFCLLLEYSSCHIDFANKVLPLFMDVNGTVLRNSYFQATTKLLLAASGFDSSKYSGHSYRAGSATSAADSGFSEWELKMLGRWASDAYAVYLRNPKIVNSFAKRLTKY